MPEKIGALPASHDNVMPEGYEEFVIVNELVKKIHELQAKYFLFKPGERVLDLGCGRGQYTKYIAEQGSNVIGSDIDANSILEAQKKYPELDLRIEDAAATQYTEDFNIVFSHMVVCNIENEQRLRQLFLNAYNAIKPGGKFFVSNCDIFTDFKPGDAVHHIINSPIRDGAKIGIRLLNAHNDYSPEWENYVWSEKKLVELLRESGFSHVDIDNSMRNKGYYFLIAQKI